MLYVLFAIHNRREKTIECMKCLQQQVFKDFKVVVFDDGSTDGSSEAILKLDKEAVVLKGDGNYWWTKSMNEGLRYILPKAKSGDYVLTLNDDTLFDKNYLKKLMEAARQLPGSIVGTTSFDGSCYEKGVTIDWIKFRYLPILAKKSELRKTNGIFRGQIDTLPCRGTLIPASVFKQIGLFDEEKLPHYAADYDFFCRAKKAGIKLIVSTEAITNDNGHSAKINKKRKTLRGFYDHLFGMRSTMNLKNQIIINSRYCPNPFLKILNLVRIIAGIPISYIIKR